MPRDALDVFVSYSHEDQTLRQELEEKLVRLRREGLVGTWRERRLTGDGEWRGWVDGDLMSADLVLLLVSEPFLASGYCRESEVKQALARHASEDAKVIPIIVRPCDWRSEAFAELRTLPQGVGPITEWHSHHDAWEDVVQGIHEIAERLEAARGAAPLPSREQTGEYRIAMLGPPRKMDPESEAPQAGAARSSRFEVIAGLAAILTAAFAVWYFLTAPKDGPKASQTTEMTARRGDPEPGSSIPDRPPTTPANVQRLPAPPSGAASPTEREPGVTESRPTRSDLADLPPGKDLAPVAEAIPDQPVAMETEGEPPATVSESPPGGEQGAAGAEPGAAADVGRSLGILAAAGAEGEGECLAVLVAGDRAVTNRACGESSSVVVMGGNALTATRDQIFDLQPWQSFGASEIGFVELFQGLGDSNGVAATRLAEDFEYQSLDAYYVDSSEVRPVECQAQADLSRWKGSGQAFVENVTFDRYAVFVEAAAEEVISIAGSQWAALLPEMISSAGESLGGFVCELSRRPPGNVVFSAAGRVVGIGYPCEPFDGLEPEVRDSLPAEIRELELDCIASLAEIRDDLR